MKKNILTKVLYIFCVVFFASCSNDDKNSTTPTAKQILIKKITETSITLSGNSDTHIADFAYKNNVLKSITDGNREFEFIYDGDKILKVNNLTNGVIDGFTTYYYNGDLLSYILSGDNQDEKTEYSYKDGVLVSQKSGYLDGTNFIIQKIEDYSFNSESNITQKIETSYGLYGAEIISKEIYSYDKKNHPMKYMNKYYRFTFGIGGFDGESANNVVSGESYYSITATDPRYYNCEIVYNDDDLPIEIKKVSSPNNILISKTVIEYQ